MGFRLATMTETYRIKVEVSLPTPKGRFERQDFWLDVRRVDSEELDELVHVSPQQDVMRRVVVGWEGVTDDQNQRFDFSEDNLEYLLGIPQVRVAMCNAYWTNVNDARQKN